MSKSQQSQPDNNQFNMLRGLFNEIYAEINEIKKKTPNGVVNAFKVERINRVLNPLYDLMKDEPYVLYLEFIPEPTKETSGRITTENGLTYSDVILILSQYRTGLEQFSQKYFYNGINI
jgi:hypothetical protein